MLNLDALNAESRIVRLLGCDFETAYLPAAIEIPFRNEYARQLKEQGGESFDPEAVMEWLQEPANQQKGVEDLAGLLAIFTSFHHPEIDKEVLLRSCNSRQLHALFGEILKTLVSAAASDEVVEGDCKKKD